jgi:hypothetical protein
MLDIMQKLRKKKIEVIDDEMPEVQPVIEPDTDEEEAPSSVKIKAKPVENDDDNVELLGENQPYSLAMYIDASMDAKIFVKFIKKVERLVRSNPDYKLYLEWLREERGLDKCAYFHNVNSWKAEIQLHHVLSNLYTICVTVANRLLSTNKRVSSFILADEVVKLHLEDKIALVPLSTTVHELVHAKKVRIPKSQIYGNYQAYYEQHVAFMDDAEKQIYADNEQYLTLQRSDLKELEYKKETRPQIEDEEEE